MLIKNISLFILYSLFPLLCFAQSGVGAGSPAPSTDKIPFSKLIEPSARITRGMFTIYTSKNHYYLQLSDSVLNRPILVVSRLLQASAAVEKSESGYGGDELGETNITFDKHQDKIFIREVVFASRSRDSSANGLFNALRKNTLPGIVMAFDIKAVGPDSASSIIDVTDFFSGNSQIMTGQNSTMAFQSDKSYIERIRSFPINTEVQALKTYGTGKGDSTITVKINTSFVILPKSTMRERYVDGRIGYFTPYNFDFDRDPQQAKMLLKISRWRLEPRPEDMDKYKRGELVEPVKPIVFYIDPATPKKWVPYLIKGVNDWQAAFEKAGFKNAIIAKEVSPDDTSWSMNDARHSVIVYKPSLFANAMGPSITDPRSGEIIESHVSWYHNVMSLVHDWYQLQAGLIDTAAQRPDFSNELMGQLIRFVSSHEIGHTLGLKHNFGSSSTVPVDSLRKKSWVELHGHTPSIMDYARFNYVAQPEDGISRKGIFPRVGDYDKWAIEWGYRNYPDIKDVDTERKMLFDLVTDSLRQNPRLYYGEQNFLGLIDARCQSEDLSNDVIKANYYGLKNLKRIITLLPKWTSRPGDGFGNISGSGLKRGYSALLFQYFTYQMHVVNCIGLGYYNNLTLTDTGKIFTPVPKSVQKRAMAFLNAEVFSNEPMWLSPQYITDKVWNPATGVVTQLIAHDVLISLLSFQRLIDIHNSEMLYPKNQYTLYDFLAGLDKGIWSDLKLPLQISSFQRSLQQAYIDQLMLIVTQLKNNGLTAIVRTHLMVIQASIKKVEPLVTDKTTKYHYQDILIKLGKLKNTL